MKINNLILYIILLFVYSCDKEIDVDINKNYPQKIIIDGNLSTETDESYVRISKTLNINEITDYPSISGAFVTITDNTLSKTDTLNELELTKGFYTKPDLVGIEGHSYTMKVKINNEVFTAISTIPYSLKFDTIIQQNSAALGIPEPPGNLGTGSVIQFLPVYSNSSHSDKYFQFLVCKNRTQLAGIIVRKDLGSMSKSVLYPIFIQAKKGDNLTIDMQFFDKDVYSYLYGLSQNINQFSTAPSNPISNISNGALGVFKAHSSQKMSITIN